MKFNLEKCEALPATRKKSHIQSDTSSQKDWLGVFTCPTLKWDLHTSHICSKAQKMLGFLRIASVPRFNLQVKRTLYAVSLVRSLLGYASEVWTPLSARGLQSMERIQRRATKVILLFPSTSLAHNERLLNLSPVSYWHELKDLSFFFKIVNGHYNIDITKFIQPKVTCIVRSTRNSSSLDCKTSTFQKSYFIRTVKLWNLLPCFYQIHPYSTVAAFKTAHYNRYRSALVTTFNAENISTWISVCCKCRSFRNLNKFRQCCY